MQPKCGVDCTELSELYIFCLQVRRYELLCQSGLRTPTLCCGALCMLSVDGAERQGLQAIPDALLDT